MGDVEDKVDREAHEERRDEDHAPPRPPAEKDEVKKNTSDAARKMRAMFKR